MGLTVNAARFLGTMRSSGVTFDKVLTLGRQHLKVRQQDISQVTEGLRLRSTINLGGGGYAEDFLKSLLDAETVDSIDASDYENATYILDLNQPCNAGLDEQFDLVFDGGTLEHVFHFPTALSNAMRMVKTGGWFVSNTIANGFSGHGFYQFSPELFFRTFQASSGFLSPIVVAQSFSTSNLATARGGPWHVVNDPADIGKRVHYSSNRPLSLLVAARKQSHLEQPFVVTPQQSDYQSVWNDDQHQQRIAKRRFQYEKVRVIPVFGSILTGLVDRYRMRKYRTFRNHDSYCTVTISQLIKQFESLQATCFDNVFEASEDARELRKKSVSR